MRTRDGARRIIGALPSLVQAPDEAPRASEPTTQPNLEEADPQAGPQPLALRAPHTEVLLGHFRRVYLSLRPADGRDISSAIGVTSAMRGEGRTTVAIGVAAAMASDLDVPVVLVEVDLAQPGMHTMLNIEAQPGISEYLRGECEIAEAVRQISDRLFAIPAGDARGDAARLIRQLTTADLRTRLDTIGAVLVLDLPPILPTSYGALATSMAESLVFVVRTGETTSPQVKDALAHLDPALTRGFVLNGRQPLIRGLPEVPRWLRSLR